ncbi:hypothetical protein [uncultured Methylobacterium sp.]|uniref:hypothetical protein n=1 Tax=uncultured Methylobacterium sp. TaxID=157278 RepID=UPI0035CC80EC
MLLAVLALTCGAPAFAQGSEDGNGRSTGQENRPAVACGTLVSLRLLMAVAPGQAGPLAHADAGGPGCKVVPRADVGAVEHRAMIGGAPFECLAIRGEPTCLWVQP